MSNERSDNKAGGTLGARISRLRERRGLTQKELANQAGISSSFLSGVENDKRNVSSEVLLKISMVLRTSLDYLMKGEEPKPERPGPKNIPPTLGRVADERGWKYTDVLTVVDVAMTVVARRSGGVFDKPIDEWSEEDWIDYYSRVLTDG